MKKLLISSIIGLMVGSVVVSNVVYNSSYQMEMQQNTNEIGRILNNYKMNKMQLEEEADKLYSICFSLGVDTSNGIPNVLDIEFALSDYCRNYSEIEQHALLDSLLGICGYDSTYLREWEIDRKMNELTNQLMTYMDSYGELMAVESAVDEYGANFDYFNYDVSLQEKIDFIISEMNTNTSNLVDLLNSANEEIDKANSEIQRLEEIISRYESEMYNTISETDQLIIEHSDMLY